MPILLEHQGYLQLAKDDTEQFSSDEFNRHESITMFQFSCNGTPATAYVKRDHDTDQFELLVPIGVPQDLSAVYRGLMEVVAAFPTLSRKNAQGQSTAKNRLADYSIRSTKDKLTKFGRLFNMDGKK